MVYSGPKKVKKKYTAGNDKVSVVSNDRLCENETRRANGIRFRNVKFKAGKKQNNATDTSQRFVEDFKTFFRQRVVETLIKVVLQRLNHGQIEPEQVEQQVKFK